MMESNLPFFPLSVIQEVPFIKVKNVPSWDTWWVFRSFCFIAICTQQGDLFKEKSVIYNKLAFSEYNLFKILSK